LALVGIYHQWDQHLAGIFILFAGSGWQIDQGELAMHFHFVHTDVNDSVNVLKEFPGCSHDSETGLDLVL
jgi:hypothetical protein